MTATLREQLRRLDDEVGALDEIESRAQLLVAAAHHTRDRNVWGGDRAISYWARLPERVRAACYAGPSLAHWWESITRMLGCHQPTKGEDRLMVATALAGGNDQQVLTVLREHSEALCLRVRLAAQLENSRTTSTVEEQELL